MKIINRKENASQIVTEIILSETKKTPLVVAVDGGSGAGKSTFVNHFSKKINAAVVTLDNFYAADIPNKKWNEYTTKEKLNKVFDWERLVRSAIKPLLQRNIAFWTTYDFIAGKQDDGTFKQKSELQELHPSNIIIVDGTYSASPALINFIDISILMDVPISVRHKRLCNREDATFLKNWHQQWGEVEDYYFNEIRPKEFYNFIIENY
jgi:uridine kinase